MERRSNYLVDSAEIPAVKMKYVFRNKLFALLIWAFDLAGNILFFPFKSINNKDFEKINNILLIRLDHIGDVLYSTHLPQAIKQFYPKAKITFLVSNAAKEILINNPYIDKIVCYDAPWFKRNGKKVFEFKRFLELAKELGKDKYDLGIDLRGDIRHIILMVLARIKFKAGFGITGGGFLLEQEAVHRNGRHPIEHNLDLLKSIGLNPDSAEPQLYISADAADSADKLLKENNIDRNNDLIIIIHPYAGYISKNWRNDRFAGLMGILNRRHNAKLILTGSKENRDDIDNIISLSKIEALNAAGKTSLQSLVALIKQSALFIGVDSGPSHIAALSGRPAVLLYSGTNKKEEWAPRTNNTVVIQKNVACGNCGRIDCDKHTCMDAISVEDVLNEITRILETKKGEVKVENRI